MKERRKMMPSAFCTTDRDASTKSGEKKRSGPSSKRLATSTPAALRLRDAVRIVLDPTYADDVVRAAVFGWIVRPQPEQDVATVGNLANRFMAATFSSRIAIPYSRSQALRTRSPKLVPRCSLSRRKGW
jgi:hypothetical protein